MDKRKGLVWYLLCCLRGGVVVLWCGRTLEVWGRWCLGPVNRGSSCDHVWRLLRSNRAVCDRFVQYAASVEDGRTTPHRGLVVTGLSEYDRRGDAEDSARWRVCWCLLVLVAKRLMKVVSSFLLMLVNVVACIDEGRWVEKEGRAKKRSSGDPSSKKTKQQNVSFFTTLVMPIVRCAPRPHSQRLFLRQSMPSFVPTPSTRYRGCQRCVSVVRVGREG